MNRMARTSVALALCSLGVGGCEDRASPANSDATRIEAHLARVSEDLRSTTPVGFTDDQLRARATTLEWLQEYREAGVFPHNHVRVGERVPVFVDPHGTPCAVGYLLLRSGEAQLVEEIVRADNLVRVRELDNDPRLAEWLATHGLTLQEAARIQPTYEGWEPSPQEPESPSGYVPGTVGVGVATAALASYGLLANRPNGGRLGWVEALTLGAIAGESYLLFATRDAGAPGWADVVNVGGLFVNGMTVALRLLGPESLRADANEVGPHPYLRATRNGTELGLALKW